MVILKGLETSVRVNGQNLEEFVDADNEEGDSPDRVTRYVEVVAEVAFQLIFFFLRIKALSDARILVSGFTLMVKKQEVAIWGQICG